MSSHEHLAGMSAMAPPPTMPLPAPPAAAAAQWAQQAQQASAAALAAGMAATKASEQANAHAAAAQAAATQAQVAQVSAQQAAAAQVAQSLGYSVAPVGVPTAAAYGSLPPSTGSAGLVSPNPMPHAMVSSASVGVVGVAAAVVGMHLLPTRAGTLRQGGGGCRRGRLSVGGGNGMVDSFL